MKDKFNMVGTEIQSFSLNNMLGESKNIEEYKGQKNVVLILLRDIN
ncbi:MAG: hypothetical protein GF364_21840 [Candidatus Lokiarchaeota archaeon]|nr:hypothetical protein [Candidatus Lokiarchaeota archaeon]